MNDFAVSDSDLVYRRNPERWILLGVFLLESLVLLGLVFGVLNKEPEKLMPTVILMGIVVAGLAVLAAWFWTYEVRVTPYELVCRSIFGEKVVMLSEIVGLERKRVKGKNPPQYFLNIRKLDDTVMKVADLKREGQWLHERLREKCKSLKQTDFVA